MLAQLANEPLGHHGFHRAGSQIGFHAHIDQSRKGAGGVIRVQSAEDQVARQRGLDGGVARLSVTDFPDENHIGIVTQNAAQAVSEGQPDLRVDVDLADAVHLILDPDPRR